KKGLALRSQIRRAGGGGSEASGTSLCRAVQPSAGPIHFRSFVLLSGPAPRPHLLTLSGVETPVNLAFVEATYALESPMEFSKLVLIVDDDLNLVELLREFFARFEHGHAYEITSARSVADALDILLRGVFDLILLDMVIPGIGTRWKQGLDLLKRIRDLGVKAPVLVMSG